MIANRRRIAALAISAAAVAAACTGPDETTPPTTVAVTTTTEPQRLGDGTLTIGLLLPTGDALLGQGLIEAATEAVDRINEAGGVLGRPIRLFEADEGDTAATAAASIDELLARDVDAIVGPASSLIALDRLRQILDPGVISCSPTASSLALDDFPDDDQLFFRTIASDSLQASAIARVVLETGARSADIVFVDDAYGQPFSQAVADALVRLGITVGDSIPFRPSDTDLDEIADQITASEPRVLVLLASADDAAIMLEAIGQSDDFRMLSSIVVNDAVRNPSAAPRLAALPSSLRARITGVAPEAVTVDPVDSETTFGPFGVNAFDCVNLIALAAAQGGTDEPQVVASQIPSVSSGGRPCRTFQACIVLLDAGLLINYNGPSGITELLQRGDPRRARFERFTFDETGRDQFESNIVVET